jgi:hypothetical protein
LIVAKKKSKASLIREYLQKHPAMGPTDVAKLVMQDHPAVKTTGKEVSKIRSEARGKKTPAGKPKQVPAKAKQAPAATVRKASIAEAVARLQQAIGTLGKDEAKRIIDLL